MTSLASFDDRYDPGIRVVPYDPGWPAVFEREAARLRRALGPEVGIEHVGSTSVPGLAAKPIIDILVLVGSLADRWFEGRLQACGYLHQPGPAGVADDFPFFGKPHGRPRQFHVHVCARHSAIGLGDLAVRDYLRSHPDEAAAYGALKASLAARSPGDRLAYMAGKDAYVRHLKERAVAWTARQQPPAPAPAGLRLAPFGQEHTEGVQRLCAAEGWPSYASNAEAVMKAFSSPGTAAVVALDGDEVAGFAFGGGDGFVQGYLMLLVVGQAQRRRGVARALVGEVFRRLGVRRMDLLADEGAEAFCRALPHRRKPGYRIYPAGPIP